jgi:glutaminase
VDEDTFEAEVRMADHNHATAYLMRSQDMTSGDVEAILALYLRHVRRCWSMGFRHRRPRQERRERRHTGSCLRQRGIGVFSPGLDAYGNSVRGMRVCQELSERLGLHNIFASEAEDALLGPIESC